MPKTPSSFPGYTDHSIKVLGVQANDSREPEESEEPLQFFNYHEFLIPNYEKLTSSNTPTNNDKSLLASHFPNNHSTVTSSTYKDTRIVRVPRVYETLHMSDLIPQFSTYVLGKEPAALTLATVEAKTYSMGGSFDDNYFGETSLTPLIPDLISEQKYIEIVERINLYLLNAFNPYNIYNAIEGLLDIMTGTLYSRIFNNYVRESHCKRNLMELESYVNNTNMQLEPQGIKIISPRRSGYLSLDIQIPRPKPV
ncbi:ras modification protein ERF4 [[Candida] anglica]|uniref:Ras modification protein ERF4 n=1 Tax=[Candida] anglica TaxID=148631 RepID=A0ABP0EH49_9ASCO